MQHDITQDGPLRLKTDKRILFRGVYKQIDAAFDSIDLKSETSIELWRQVRKVIGEYVGNLYKHDPVVTKAFVEIEIKQAVVSVRICHDGEEFDQFSRVDTISAGMKALGAAHKKFYGTGGLEGISFDATF